MTSANDAADESGRKAVPTRGVAVIGAAGHVGTKVLNRLIADRRGVEHILALDVREVPAAAQRDGVVYDVLDVRSAELSERFQEYGVDCVVHLATVVAPLAGMSVHDLYSMDVDGTHNVVEACLTADVKHLVIVSSGAVYGFHADTPNPVTETAPLRGNDEYPFARHKRLIEEFLARYREAHPELAQLILRPGTILGERTTNALTELFLRPVIVGVSGAASPFSFILDEDVASCIVMGIHNRRAGVFNLAGDGVITLQEIAARTGARLVELPAEMLRVGLGVLNRCRITQWGPEQVAFLQYRPVLSNEALRRDFGFTPTKTSREVFDLWWNSKFVARR